MAFSDRCSEGAKKALALAQDAARSMGHNYVGSEHLLLGLINEGEGAAAAVEFRQRGLVGLLGGHLG